MRQLLVLTLGLVLGASACSPVALAPSERPGLGTAWGETRESPIFSVSFEREDPDRPFAVSILHYDDAAGVRALAGQTPSLPEEGWIDGPLDGPIEGALKVRVLDERGWPLQTFRRGGLLLVEGHRGQRYSIEISNRGRHRIEAVATVDGLDVMDGGPGSLAKRGYVVRPGGRCLIDGFRRSERAVAAFRFGSVDESYAASNGDDANVGVIGVAFFAERGAPADRLGDEAARRPAADPFPDAFARPPASGW